MKLKPNKYLDVLVTYYESQHSFWVTVISDSMIPTFEKGDKVLIERKNKFHIGDIVFFYRRNFLIHRLLYVQNGCAYCKGDHNEDFDPPVPLDQVIGIVTRIHKRNGNMERDRYKLQALLRAIYIKFQGGVRG